MTNEQLKILLENQATLLRIAIKKAVELMPEGAEREMELYSKTSTKRVHGLVLDESNYDKHPTGKHLALIPLYDHLESIERQYCELIFTQEQLIEAGQL